MTTFTYFHFGNKIIQSFIAMLDFFVAEVATHFHFLHMQFMRENQIQIPLFQFPGFFDRRMAGFALIAFVNLVAIRTSVFIWEIIIIR
jgi:hypothetical protein